MKRQVVDKVMWEIRGVRPNMVGTVGTLASTRTKPRYYSYTTVGKLICLNVQCNNNSPASAGA